MTTGPSESGDGRGEAAAAGHVPADDGAPTEALVSGAVGDRCVNCGTPLSSDQRYCVACGERRGQPRFSLPATGKLGEEGGAARPAASRRGMRDRRPRISSGATMVAGVGTLLLAMGVGVLIGHDTSNSTKQVAAAPTQVIKVGGGSGTSGGGGSSSSGSSKSSGSSQTRHKSSGSRHTSTNARHTSAKSRASTSAPPPVVVHKASQAAVKVLGGSAKNVPPPTVTQGQKGTGAGFNKKTHKFDGSFFGQ